jgi:ribonuclease-3
MGFKEELRDFVREIGVGDFNDWDLLERALTHKSYAVERGHPMENNQKLEFLGDSVLGMVVSEYLYKRYSKYDEGELSKFKAIAVSERVLSEKARKIGLGRYIRLGKGEEHTGGRSRASILADTMEALIGAIYLDKGLDAVRSFIIQLLADEIDRMERDEYERDYKTALQELTQKRYKVIPVYETVGQYGPDHDRTFEVVVRIKGVIVGRGIGGSKRRAEQAAAKEALERIASWQVI